MSANSGPLKPGTLCWLTFTTAANIGKVVEVISLTGTFHLRRRHRRRRHLRQDLAKI